MTVADALQLRWIMALCLSCALALTLLPVVVAGVVWRLRDRLRTRRAIAALDGLLEAVRR